MLHHSAFGANFAFNAARISQPAASLRDPKRCRHHFFFAHRAAAAMLATSLRFSGVIFFRRAFPPRRPRATAAGSFRLAMVLLYAKRLGSFALRKQN